MMSRGDLPGKVVWGRSIKPVGLGVAVSMIVLGVFNTMDIGVLQSNRIGDVVAIAAAVSAVLLITAWVIRSQSMTEAGLFIGSMTMLMRSVFLFALYGSGQIGVWLGIGTAIIALGAFMLERSDDDRGAWWTTSSRRA